MTNTATVIGNIAADPELKYTPNGKAVVTFSIADTPRSFDKQSGQWVDGETDWVRAVIWDEQAEHVAASLRKGNQVIAIGRYQARKYTDKNTNETRTTRELVVEHIGPSLRFATAVVEKAQRAPRANNPAPSAPANDAFADDTPF